LFGYARLPWVEYIQPILSARLPVITPGPDGFSLKVEVQNFGQTASGTARIKIAFAGDGQGSEIASGKIPALKPFEKTTVGLTCGKIFSKGVDYDLMVIINPDDKKPVILHGRVTPD
jgi:hypothetical protein